MYNTTFFFFKSVHLVFKPTQSVCSGFWQASLSLGGSWAGASTELCTFVTVGEDAIHALWSLWYHLTINTGMTWLWNFITQGELTRGNAEHYTQRQTAALTWSQQVFVTKLSYSSHQNLHKHERQYFSQLAVHFTDTEEVCMGNFPILHPVYQNKVLTCYVLELFIVNMLNIPVSY